MREFHRAEIERRFAHARQTGGALSLFVQLSPAAWMAHRSFADGANAVMRELEQQTGLKPSALAWIDCSGTLIVAGGAEFMAALLAHPHISDPSPCNLIGWPGRVESPRPPRPTGPG